MTTVLVVDDEYLIVEVLTLALEDVGFMVTQASNGKKALDALHREGLSLVVCDFMMPLMNGLELAEEIRRHAEWSHIPIVLMSGGHAGLASQAPGLFDHILQKTLRCHQVHRHRDRPDWGTQVRGTGRRLRQPTLISAAIGWRPLKISCQVARLKPAQCDFGHWTLRNNRLVRPPERAFRTSSSRLSTIPRGP